MFPNVSVCNAKRCVCYTQFCTKTTVTSSVNGRQFSIIKNNKRYNAHARSMDVFFVFEFTEEENIY